MTIYCNRCHSSNVRKTIVMMPDEADYCCEHCGNYFAPNELEQLKAENEHLRNATEQHAILPNRFAGCDRDLQPLLVALAESDLESDWSCEGNPGHMCIRPYVQIRTFPNAQASGGMAWIRLQEQRREIELVMNRLHVKDYWLQLTYSYGAQNTHGNEPVWILQIPGRFDYIAGPIPYSVRYQDETEGKERIALGALPIGQLLMKGA